MLHFKNSLTAFLSFSLLYFVIDASQLQAQEETTTSEPQMISDPIIRDVNGNGIIDIIAFGDSITRGVGDFTRTGEDVTEPSRPQGEAGYPLRVENFLHVSVQNRGVPGEVLFSEGLPRFALLIPASRPDFVVLSGGTNDAIHFTTDSEYSRAVQTMLNIAYAVGTVPIIATVTPVCCEHSGTRPFIESYNNILRGLAHTNNTDIADISHAYENTCRGEEECHLLNLPEGEHPNTAGYDVSGEVVTAKFLNIDIFAPDGPLLLSQAIGVAATDIKTVPDPIVASSSSPQQ